MSRIRIELLSDLCTGSGYSFGGIIDGDICFDELGIPYIPARRIKGCMRESLENILYAKYADKKISDRLFGIRGRNIAEGAIRIGNAYVQNYFVLKDYLARNSGKLGVDQQSVLDRYTHVVGQTAMKDGVADNMTLRYTRVINEFDPCTNEPLVFEAQISYDEVDEQIVEDILKSTRHLGMKRNRGMGNVRCCLEKNVQSSENTEKTIEEFIVGDKTRLSFVMENKEPLVLSGEAESETNDYISGKMLIGMLASKYLKAGGDAESEEFKNLFLDGSTIYSNMYPYKNGKTYYPAPDYVNVLKKTKKYVYVVDAKLPVFNDNDQSEYNYNQGNQPKKLKGKYVSLCENEIDVLEMKRDVVFHHRHEKAGNEEMLYSLTCIAPGQKFLGTIDVNEKYIPKIKELLRGECYFGKSRSAQYGLCELSGEKQDHDTDNGICVGKGGYLVVTFKTDAVIVLDTGRYSVYYDEIRKCIASELGIEYEDESDPKYISSIQTKVITGYMSKWNLRNEPIPGIKAGSYLVYKLTSDFKGSASMVGVRNMEGYGRVDFMDAEACRYDCIIESKKDDEGKKIEAANEYIRNLIAPVFVDEWVASIIGSAIDNKEFERISNAAIGRWKLMLMESLDMHDDPKASFEEFKNRIGSIKTEDTRKQGERLYKRVERIFNINDRKISDSASDCANKLRLLGIDEEEIVNILRSRWPEYVYAVLTNRKYMGGNRK